ncbi:hypothetical protein IW261DRAFT_1474631 [Armillaria novae-zelandiae]|uniref:Uncharacterized protein n=1 Tax=Armillaria novae-zelandiae TaxID=153914 RepID=A0AA39UIZ3_9AGAR|nr:hypothetical protein IW261DRAFT_1474631 [Armillaria novae-zelandiae]
MGFSSQGSFSRREGSERTPQPRPPDVPEHANESNTTSLASVPLESGFQEIPPLSFSMLRNLHLAHSSPVYLTGPLELDEADYGTYSNTAGREHRTLGTRYSNAARRSAFIPDGIETILESTSDVLPEIDAPTFGSRSSPSPNLLPVSPRMRSPRTLGLIDELTDTMAMDALHLGPVTQPSSPSLEPGVMHYGQTSRDSQTLSLSPSQSFASQSSSQPSETSLGSVGYKSALIQLRDTLGPLTNLLTLVPRCQGCDAVLLKPSNISFAGTAPPYFQELRAGTSCELKHVLLVCPGCLQPYCAGCGERIRVPDQGGTWFRAAMNCCNHAGLIGLLNVLSDLDLEADGLHPKIVDLLRIINDSFVNRRQPVHSLAGPIIRCSKLLKLMDEMFHAFMLDEVPLDSDSWRVYDQMTRLMWAFSGDSQLRLLIKMDTYIFPHNAGGTSRWIRDGLQEDWDHGLPMLVSLRRRISLIDKVLQKYQGQGVRRPTESPYKCATMVHLKAILGEWKEK